ncbi:MULTISPECIES: ATP-binding protein [Vibrio]|uniref:Histidine kinase/HSP90-like ATPase domain-containing protein n=1 Tax=Vibrio aestuarianus TaxID=28171 RepID=A0A9X4IY40_9VIBR|nr:MULTISPECIES: ATP-binding protein [Vibrio]MDE1211805.1 hypothetical protein [Vibrio aestuarianus]MDE1231603.1 hypothetical protein [Vibrio aestuarianus]MDE1236157.1 hypothetical protein [Vibrio aestuarianus]MDE1247054.1 hypothetical protein [Vibrio aestuarianus]MDE1252001.1 hypothetical protein [Vibrio aestuarianus]
MDPPADIPNILGEEQRLRQVLGNLLTNAIDAMKAAEYSDAVQSKNMIIIRITDNRCGKQYKLKSYTS